ncbi:LysM peptidoglycan-binding domain-containing protein, partial [Kitasatospora sp. NPDC004531]
VLASQGPGAWPVCSVKAGLTKGGTPAQVDTSSASTAATATPSVTKTTKPAAAQSDKAAVNTTAADDAASRSQTRAQAPQAADQGAKNKTAQGEQSWKKHNAGAAKADGGSYTVKSGDTLSAIAAANGTTVDALFKANAKTIGASADVIFPGQVLSV